MVCKFQKSWILCDHYIHARVTCPTWQSRATNHNIVCAHVHPPYFLIGLQRLNSQSRDRYAIRRLTVYVWFSECLISAVFRFILKLTWVQYILLPNSNGLTNSNDLSNSIALYCILDHMCSFLFCLLLIHGPVGL